jgi:hypothetical protein
VNIYLPDQLANQLAEQFPDLNRSALVQDALRRLVECDHATLNCAHCGSTVHAAQWAAELLGGFYRRLHARMENHLNTGGTVVGACKVLRGLAIESGAKGVADTPELRQTNKQRPNGGNWNAR